MYRKICGNKLKLQRRYDMKSNWKTTGMVVVAAICIGAVGLVYGGNKGGRNPMQPGSISVERQMKLEYPDKAQISFENALQIASEKTAGKALKAELDRRKGSLVYDIETIRPDKSVMKVVVDAGNGAVLDVREAKNHSDK
jgi:hypothetical protein